MLFAFFHHGKRINFHLSFTTVQAPSVPEPQNQYVQHAQVTPGLQNQYAYQAPGVPMSQNYYANQAPSYPQNNMNVNQVPLNNHGDQQKSVGSKGLSSNIFSINHVF